MCSNELNSELCQATIEHLGNGEHGTRRLCMAALTYINSLSGVPDLGTLLERLDSLIGTRWGASTSKTNGRFEHFTDRAPNSGAEVRIERLLVDGDSDNNWANQLPFASGHLRDNDGNVAQWRRMSVDLGRRVEAGNYEFIELKVDSDNWLFAAIEITKYGLFYSRLREDTCAYFRAQDLRRAKKIGLRVLAPPEFYSPQRELRRTFEARLDSAWREFSRTKGVMIDFAFRQWDVRPECLPDAPSLRRMAEAALRMPF